MRERRTYSREFKKEAIRLVKEERISCTQAEKDLGIGKGVISRWIREKEILKRDAFTGSGNVRPSEREYKNLKKEPNRTKRELEILKKSRGHFLEGTESIFRQRTVGKHSLPDHGPVIK